MDACAPGGVPSVFPWPPLAVGASRLLLEVAFAKRVF
jgi:hypothetical protein